jgi:hypothetical protein
MDNTSLEDFLDDSEDGEDAADSDGSVPGESDEEVADPPTSRWRPDGAACPVCGDPTTRFWHDDGQFVCPDCKEWG